LAEVEILAGGRWHRVYGEGIPDSKEAIGRAVAGIGDTKGAVPARGGAEPICKYSPASPVKRRIQIPAVAAEQQPAQPADRAGGRTTGSGEWP
jgi:hypothetical protein